MTTNQDNSHYFKTQLGQEVFVKKYSEYVGMDGKTYKADWLQRCKDIGSHLERIDRTYPNWKTNLDQYILHKQIIPQGSALSAIANNVPISTSNCYVVVNDSDSYAGIMEIDQHLVQLMKRRGGVGVDLSHLRPKGAKVNNAAKTSTGIVSFASRFSNTTREVGQGNRRGACLLSLDINHEDAIDFITAKTKRGEINGANISVKIDDKFMESPNEEKMKILCESMWESAEPGILFSDTINRESSSVGYGKDWKISCTNPCGRN